MGPGRKDRLNSENDSVATSIGPGSWRTIARQILPGAVLPGIVYFTASRYVPLLTALALASSVPMLDIVARRLRGKPPTAVGLVFVAVTAISIGLATWFQSPEMIVAKGPLISGVVGTAFALSATFRRPLVRTLALHLTTDHHEHRRLLADRWSRPNAVAVFRILSLGWGLLLLASAAQQGLMAVSVSPGAFITLEAPIRLIVTGAGIGASILYVRRRQQVDPELGMLPGTAS